MRVLLTGHTGFKGAWLALWLAELGDEVHGLSTAPPSDPSLYEQARVRDVLADEHHVDVRDAQGVADAVRAAWAEDAPARTARSGSSARRRRAGMAGTLPRTRRLLEGC